MLLGNVVNQLLNQNGFTYSSATEQTGLTTLQNRTDQIHNLNTGFKDLSFSRLLSKGGSLAVNRIKTFAFYNSKSINRHTVNIEHAAKCFWADRDTDWLTGSYGFQAARQTVSRTHRNGPY